MDKKSVHFLVDFFKSGKFLQQVHDGLIPIQRWLKFAMKGLFRKQSSFEHSFDTGLLAILVIEKIAPYYPNMDKYALLACANLHELGEIKFRSTDPGDVLWENKQDNNDHILQELDVFFRLMKLTLDDDDLTGLVLQKYLLQYLDNPKVKELLIQDPRVLSYNKYAISGYAFEAEVFDAIEKLGYVLDVIRQHDLKPKKSFPLLLKVLHNQYQKLYQYSQEIQGFDYFYSEDIHKQILQLLIKYPLDRVNKMLDKALK